jgi:hypothetical protein
MPKVCPKNAVGDKTPEMNKYAVGRGFTGGYPRAVGDKTPEMNKYAVGRGFTGGYPRAVGF